MLYIALDFGYFSINVFSLSTLTEPNTFPWICVPLPILSPIYKVNEITFQYPVLCHLNPYSVWEYLNAVKYKSLIKHRVLSQKHNHKYVLCTYSPLRCSTTLDGERHVMCSLSCLLWCSWWLAWWFFQAGEIWIYMVLTEWMRLAQVVMSLSLFLL